MSFKLASNVSHSTISNVVGKLNKGNKKGKRKDHPGKHKDLFLMILFLDARGITRNKIDMLAPKETQI